MRSSPHPKNEKERLQALSRSGIVNTPKEERFDRVTRLAKRVFNVDSCLVSLIAEDSLWAKSTAGIELNTIPRDLSFCGHAILQKQILEVPDTRDDPRFADNPFVTEEPKVRFYAGAPLNSVDGYRLGTLCLLHSQPRALSDDERATLRDLADIVQDEVNRDQAASMQALLSERSHLERLSVLAAECGTGIAITDPKGTVQWVNGGLLTLTGYKEEVLINQPIASMLQGEKTDGMSARAMRNGLEKGTGFKVDMLKYRANDEPFWVHVKGFPQRSIDGTLLGFVAVYTDLSELRQVDLGIVEGRDASYPAQPRSQVPQNVRNTRSDSPAGTE